MGECKHNFEHVGIVLFNESTGYATEGYICRNCGKKVQVPTMYEPDQVLKFYRDCIFVNEKGEKG